VDHGHKKTAARKRTAVYLDWIGSTRDELEAHGELHTTDEVVLTNGTEDVGGEAGVTIGVLHVGGQGHAFAEFPGKGHGSVETLITVVGTGGTWLGGNLTT